MNNYTTPNYKHINFGERATISSLYDAGYSIRKISSILKRSASTISREIKRNTDTYRLDYTSKIAQEKANIRHKHKYLFKFSDEKYLDFADHFVSMYDKCTHGIKATLFFLRKHYPELEHFSFKTVYNWFNSGHWFLKRSDRLRRGYVKGRKRGRTSAKHRLVQAKYYMPFWTRDEEINNRNQIGHYELDLVVSSNRGKHACILTIVERYSRYGFAIKIPSRSPKNVYNALIKWRKDHIEIPVFSMTTDNGFEFKNMGLIAYKLGIRAYYTDPYASFQKGSNENFNGIIRRKWKKGTNFDDVSQEELNDYVGQVNAMPRELLNWLTAKQKFIQGWQEEYYRRVS
ncbi:IS30 family transposase [Mycoplasmopsis cynos]|uniref:IS30 family transposase n=1 Tax=Mycoplasmopsis cynos TaxID=171284 RepID=UPI002AFFCD6A|nr:IS30 family transposase [Mycoplasmopsis cynos]WQQ16133.1 IS30 family transposase [Mycoplasmopsis cynos]